MSESHHPLLALTSRSGPQVGAENLRRLQTYLDGLRVGGQRLPEHRGKANMMAIAEAIGVDRGVLYKNRHCAAEIRRAVEEMGLEPPSSGEIHDGDQTEEGGAAPLLSLDPRDQRIGRLEQENLRLSQICAAQEAENLELRRKLRQFEHIEEAMVQTGRKIWR